MYYGVRGLARSIKILRFGTVKLPEEGCWEGVISCCIQRANAKILRGEPVPGRHATPVPGGMFSLGRDLRLATG